jgi:two-component system, LytTR family, sensor kinase
MPHRLSAKQKGQLALIVLVVYYPIFLYMFLPPSGLHWQAIRRAIPFFVIDGLVILLVYFIWLSVSEWILHRLFKTFGEDFMSEFNLLAHLVTILISIALAITFVIAYRSFVLTMYELQQVLFDTRLRSPFSLYQLAEARSLIRRSMNGYFIMLMLSGFYLIANRRATLRFEEVSLKAERLEKESVQSQFAALKNQINPHFLFNSLSILSSLVHVNADLSEKFIDQLSKAYRYILEQKDNEQVALKTELDFIQSYVFLLKIRFEDKFLVNFDIPPSYENQYRIAPLTLQLLVENVVKHNQMSEEEPLHVHILAQNDELVIKNNLKPRPQSNASTGVGLQNIINRYGLLTDRKVWVGETDGNFIVRIPLLS